MARVGGTPENLLPGGVEGNKGGTGRPPSQLRAAMRDILANHGIEKLERIVSGTEDGVSPSESLKGIEVCGKFGLGEAKQVVAEEVIQALAEVLAEDERIPEDCIGDITSKLIEKLKAIE